MQISGQEDCEMSLTIEKLQEIREEVYSYSDPDRIFKNCATCCGSIDVVHDMWVYEKLVFYHPSCWACND